MLFAQDEADRIHAVAYIVWDEHAAYYLLGGSDPDLRTSGAASLLMWEAIMRARRVTDVFDFEGSMLKPVERFFRAFGARQTPYLNVSRRAALSRRAHNAEQWARLSLAYRQCQPWFRRHPANPKGTSRRGSRVSPEPVRIRGQAHTEPRIGAPSHAPRAAATRVWRPPSTALSTPPPDQPSQPRRPSSRNMLWDSSQARAQHATLESPRPDAGEEGPVRRFRRPSVEHPAPFVSKEATGC